MFLPCVGVSVGVISVCNEGSWYGREPWACGMYKHRGSRLKIKMTPRLNQNYLHGYIYTTPVVKRKKKGPIWMIPIRSFVVSLQHCLTCPKFQAPSANNDENIIIMCGSRWHNCLKYCATWRKAEGSISYMIWLDPSTDLFYRVQTGFGAQPVSYPKRTGG